MKTLAAFVCLIGIFVVSYLSMVFAWGLTVKGNAFVAMLTATPLPQERFIDPRTDEVVKGLGVP